MGAADNSFANLVVAEGTFGETGEWGGGHFYTPNDTPENNYTHF